MISIARQIESALLPLPNAMHWNRGKIQHAELTTAQKIQGYASQAFRLLASIALLPIVCLYSLACYAIAWIKGASDEVILSIDPDSENLTPQLPKHVGFSDSLFQSSGLGMHSSATELEGLCNWNHWLKTDRVDSPENAKEMFVDILNDPKPFIKVLKKMNVTAHRFSLEWSVIEPQKGIYNEKAIQLYRNFIRELKQAHIEPYVTLHHFTSPDWFSQDGDFANSEHIDLFVQHCLHMMELFPEIKHWLTCNEPGVYALQSCIFGKYPPGGRGDFPRAAEVLRNLLIAHCKIYRAAKDRFQDKVEIGITHQWLRFVPLTGTGNPLERTLCYFLSKIIHNCVYEFFKTGHFQYQIPLQTNTHFTIPADQFQENNRFLDFIGVQFYGYPRVKVGWNSGLEYPGYKVQQIGRFTAGSTCPEGGKVLSLGLGFYPESLTQCLEEASLLQKPIAITETGCDANVKKWGHRHWAIDNATQREYFAKIVPILNRFQTSLKAVFIWTLHRGHLEWDRGNVPKLGVVRMIKNPSQTIIGCRLSPAAQFLRSLFDKQKQQLSQQTQ